MFLAAFAIMVLAFAALAMVGASDVHSRYAQRERDLNAAAGTGSVTYALAGEVDPLEAARFTASLLCLGRVQQAAVHNSPAPETVESSSLVSVRPAQSRNPVAVS